MTDKTITGEPKEINQSVKYWLGEIASAKKREKDYRKEGERVKSIYDGKKKDAVPFNILYSNTETLIPALYGAVPRPVVQRRFKDADPLGKLSAQAATRGLEYFMDTNMEEYASFDSCMQDAVLDALLPGRGVTRLKYEPVIEGVTDQIKTYEAVCPESVTWNRVVFGYCQKWAKLPWLAFEHHMTKYSASKVFEKSVVDKMIFTKEETDDDEERIDRAVNENTMDMPDTKTCVVYEIWDRDGGKKVKFVSQGYKDGYLKEDDDPLELTGFFPVPEPLRFLKKANDQMPVALYLLYENQAKELNIITTRLNKLIAALKVRGAYDSTISELEQVMKADDNSLIPAENVAALQDSNGIEKAIWLMPLEKIIAVVQQLFVARQQCKQVIYEITGISDILRGQSVASETATAQEIKNQWGTLRLKRMQKDVQRYAREMLRITLEIMGKHFSEQTFAAMTGMQQIIPTEQKQQAQMLMQIAQFSGQPVPPQVQEAAAKPSWGEVLGLLRNDQQRAYRIDIETNSTVDLEATEDQKNMTEALTAVSQTLQGLTPLVISGSLPFGAAQSLLLAVVRRFRFGPEIEDQIMQMVQPKPPDDGKQAEQAKMQMEMQKSQAEREDKKAEMAFEVEKAKAEEMRIQAVEASNAQREQQKMTNDLANKRIQIEAERQTRLAEINAERQTEKLKMEMQQETELQKAAIAAAAQIQIAQISAAAQERTAKAEGEAEGKKEEGESKVMAGMQESITAIAETLRALAAPKSVKRDKEGRIVQLVTAKA